jgi:chromosome partitioning protein
MKIISLVNQKGGVAKTTSAVNLAAAFSILGKRVLLIDIDPQGNASTNLGFENIEANTISELLLENSVKASDCLIPTKDLTLIPSDISLAEAEVTLINKMAREFILKKKLASITGNYDYCFIDCPPSLSTLTLNALVASHKVYIPMMTSKFSVKGIQQLLDTIDAVQNYNEELLLGGIFITNFDIRNSLATSYLGQLQEILTDEHLLQTKIRVNIDLAKAQDYNETIFEYNDKSNGALDYMELAKEIIEREEK